MDYGKAFSYTFEDKDWIKKLLIAGVVAIVPIVNFAVLGWLVEIIRRVSQGEAELLPDWSRFGELFKRGFMAFVIVLVYLLPAIAINICSAATGAGLRIAEANSTSSDLASTMATAATVLQLCFSCLNLILSIAAYLLLPSALGTFAETGQIGPALRFQEVVGLFRSSPGPFIISLVILGFLSPILLVIGFLVCIVGVIPAYAYIAALSGHLYGQAYREAKSKSGTTMQPAMTPMS
ncbi:MAG: DUF4013 domain-containing protein [Chloroflexi bacterium]|nr:DUF4013 domain-containing protein [Chloroflexota bacterium]